MPANNDYTTLYGGAKLVPPTTTPTAPTVPNVQTTPATTPAAETQPVVQPESNAMANAQGAAPAVTAQDGYSQQGANLPPTPDYTGQINDIYDKYLAAQRAQLDSGYEANMRELEAAAAKIPGLYQQRGNDLNAQYERNRAALNEQMAANGLNVGTGSQAQLAQNAGYQRAYGQIMAAQADAQAALEQQRVAKEAEYQAAISQALANNDYQRAVALTQELKNQRSADLDRAKTLASYGDFSGYAQVYGQDAANNMREVWNAQNPDFAYMTGNLTADQYYRLTGKMPNGTQAAAGYGYTQTTTGDGNTTTDEDREIPTPPGTPGTTGRDWAAYDIRNARSAQEALNAYNSMRDSTWDGMSAGQQKQITDFLKNKWGIVPG